MQKSITQLTLELSLKDEATFDNFYPGNNVEILSVLKKVVYGQGEKSIYLQGGKSLGCSHLLQAACHFAYSQQIRSVYLPFSQLLNFTPELLHGLESVDLICLDDLQLIAGQLQWEESVFHLFNRVYDIGGRLIIGAKDLPKAIGFNLPDLISRLSWGVVYKLQPLTDQEKIAALIMRAYRRGMYLSNEVANYILTHSPRQMDTLFAALDVLDQASLAAQRRLTIPFIKEVLEI